MSPAESGQVVCSHEGCEAPAGGACALGHASPIDCPESTTTTDIEQSVSIEQEEPARDASEGVPDPPEPSGVALRSGVSLTVDKGNQLSNSKGASFILPVGPIEAGKTTFLIELYAQFVKEIRDDRTFAGSETLLDFELLAFPSRIRSGNTIPETWRTRLQDSGQPLLHLAVGQAKRISHLLLGNYSGELFEHICDRGNALRELPLLASCNRLLVFVDGGKVAKGGTRTSAVSRTRQFIGVLSEEKPLPAGCKIGLVLAKLDEVEKAGPAAVEAWASEESLLLEKLGALGHEAKPFRIAARPLGSAAVDQQIDDLVGWLLEEDRLASHDVPIQPDPTRAYETYRSN